jgi:nicotinamide phosphoribosyltransferase
MFSDFYKTDHRRQYPLGTEIVYSNFTARGSRIPNIDGTVVFGIQYFIKKVLMTEFQHDFFDRDKEVVAEYKRRLDTSLGKDAVPIEHIEALWKLGYMPIEIKALEEGTVCPIRVPCLTIKNTIPEFFWLTNFLETVLSNTIWGMITSATIAHEYRKIFAYYAEKTSSIPDFVDFQGHDFSMRGMWGIEAACMSGAAHLLSFKGTDTIPAIDFLEKYYNANSEKELIGCSVPATEHSVMCLGGDETEIETYKRLLSIYPKGILSVVSDTWDYWQVLTQFLPEIKPIIMARNGKLVIRPDSGDPVKIICGDPNSSINHICKGSVEILWDLFGGTINAKGYKELDSHIGLIYGDSITLDRATAICEGLEAKGFATTNVVYGIGSYTYQYVTRDTFGFAMKSTYGVVNGEPKNIYKNPKTDNGLKNSAKGLLKVDENLNLIQEVSVEEEKFGLLKTVFKDGILVKETSLAEIRERLNKKFE